VAYRLDLPPTLKIHPVFHVSLIQQYRSDGRVQPPPPPLELEDGLEYEVERILSHRDQKVRTKGKRTVIRTDYLVSWVGYGPEHNSFETEENLKNAQDAIQEYSDVTLKRSAGEKRRRRAGVFSNRRNTRGVNAMLVQVDDAGAAEDLTQPSWILPDGSKPSAGMFDEDVKS
jgi:hypothetical protein